jgi:IS1 family transposase
MTTLTALSGAFDSEAKAKRSADAKTKKNRVQLDFAPRSMERLNALKEKTEASSYAEVVKNALRLYEALIEEAESGKQFLTRDADGVVSPFRMFL